MKKTPLTNTRQQQTKLLFGQAKAAYKAREYVRALDFCQQLESVNTEDPGVYNLKALVLVQLGKPEDAAQAIEKSVDLKPSDPKIRSNAAYIYDSILRYEMAIRHAEKACEISPKNSGLEPVFIVGMPRSGSSLCEQVLTTNSTAYGCGELATMLQLEQRFINLGVNYYLRSGPGALTE